MSIAFLGKELACKKYAERKHKCINLKRKKKSETEWAGKARNNKDARGHMCKQTFICEVFWQEKWQVKLKTCTTFHSKITTLYSLEYIREGDV